MVSKEKITLEDIAKKAGVSVPTVSQALAGKGRISQATRDRILQVVEELSYRPDPAAQSLRRRRAKEPAGRAVLHMNHKSMKQAGFLEYVSSNEMLAAAEIEGQQREQEGYDVTGLRPTPEALRQMSRPQLSRLYRELLSAPKRADYPYEEPVSLEAIRAARPEGQSEAALVITPSELYDRIYGGWLARVIGCVLGKPIEAEWPKSRVIQYLKLANAYPLTNYIPRILPLPEQFILNGEPEGTFLNEIKGAPVDDDTDFTILALHLLETYGLEFTPRQLAGEWLTHLSYNRIHTAERITYRNLICNIPPVQSAEYLNPVREFIGGRIRADLYGFVTPGKPELGAALAYKDVILSHTKNGVYAAMFWAAIISWAFVSDDLDAIIHAGLSQIPDRCRLAKAVRDLLSVRQQEEDWEAAYDRLLEMYGSYHPAHVINNTVWSLVALLYGGGDFTRTLGITVTCGMDTGCNSANVGSVLGVLLGASAIPQHWSAPLDDTLHTAVAQFEPQRISDLARRTARIAEIVLTQNSIRKDNP